jgi:hypothetical protein
LGRSRQPTQLSGGVDRINTQARAA